MANNQRQVMKEWRERCREIAKFMLYDKRRKRAYKILKDKIESGKIAHPRKLICVDCGDNAWCYDHRDYRKPLLIVPVCRLCNIRRGEALPSVRLPSLEKTVLVLAARTVFKEDVAYLSGYLARRKRHAR